MRRFLPILAVIMLAACQEETAQNVDPVPLTPDTIGHYCQMTLAEHPGPKAQVHLDGLPQAPLFFSQVRDAIAYARLPERDHRILAIWVSDMGAEGATWDDPGAGNWVDANVAVYVVGSDMEGGMGADELVPFADADAAAGFAALHHGRVMGLEQIPDSAVIPADGPQDDGADAEFERRLKALGQTDQTGG